MGMPSGLDEMARLLAQAQQERAQAIVDIIKDRIPDFDAGVDLFPEGKGLIIMTLDGFETLVRKLSISAGLAVQPPQQDPKEIFLDEMDGLLGGAPDEIVEAWGRVFGVLSSDLRAFEWLEEFFGEG